MLRKYAKFEYQIKEIMNTTTLEREANYQSPVINVINIIPEGVLCVSGDKGTEELGENFGSW
jgi:hypothetical protein